MIHELAEERRIDFDEMAECAIGMCLDNAGDMREDPYEHLREAWEGYVYHAVEWYSEALAEIHGEEAELSDKEFSIIEQFVLGAARPKVGLLLNRNA